MSIMSIFSSKYYSKKNITTTTTTTTIGDIYNDTLI